MAMVIMLGIDFSEETVRAVRRLPSSRAQTKVAAAEVVAVGRILHIL